jgi:hypothetical protein
MHRKTHMSCKFGLPLVEGQKIRTAKGDCRGDVQHIKRTVSADAHELVGSSKIAVDQVKRGEKA